jgi:excisionase family DNA binding protein
MEYQQKYYSVSEAAKAMNLCVETIRRYISNGRLQAVRLPGGHYRIRQDDLKILPKKY